MPDISEYIQERVIKYMYHIGIRDDSWTDTASSVGETHSPWYDPKIND